MTFKVKELIQRSKLCIDSKVLEQVDTLLPRM